MSGDLEEHVIAVIGRYDAGKTTFIKAVRDAAVEATHRHPVAEERPTLGLVEHRVPLPDGKVLRFLDTPGFDGHQAGGGHAKEPEEVLQMLEDHLATKGAVSVTHVLVFLNANDMNKTKFGKGPARQAFKKLFPNSKVVCITTRWDQVEGNNGRPITAEEARRKEESLYASGRTRGSLLEYLHARQNHCGNVLHFRSGLPTEAYTSPQDIIQQLFGGQASDPILEERLAAVTKERDDIAAKYELLLREKGAPTILADAAPGPKEPVRSSRNRRQRLLDTINIFAAQVLAMVAELDVEALDVSDECKANRREFEAASAAIKVAESRFAEEKENVKAVVEEYTKLRREQDALKEQKRLFITELNGLQSASNQSPVRAVPEQKQRLTVRLKRTQASLEDTENWMTTTEGDYRKGCEQVERVAAEVEKLRRIAEGKERELKEWLSPESEWFMKERENLRALQESVSTNLDAMRDGLRDSWERKLGDNTVFLDGLGGHTVHPEMVARPGDWAPVIESFYESQVSLVLPREMAKFHSAVLQRLKIQEEVAQREWKKGIETIFGQRVPGFKKCSLPQLIPSSEDLPPLSKGPGVGVPQDLPLFPSLLKGHIAGVRSVAFSRDGTKLVSGSNDNTVRVWDASTGKVQRALAGHSDHCTSVAISEDGSWIVSGSDDKTVRIWDATTGKVQRVLAGHDKAIKSVALSWDGSRICSAGDDNTVRVWDTSTGKVKSILQGHNRAEISVAFSRDGTRIVSGGWDKVVRVWNASTTTCRLHRVLKGHTDRVSSVAFSADGSRIVSGSSDQTARVWDVSTGRVLWVLAGHNSLVTSVAFSSDGKRIVSGGYDNKLRVWDALTGGLQSVLEGHSNIVRSVAFSSDGSRIASGASDNDIRMWASAPVPVSH
ncbi:hypothetical protein D9611_010506 [Ephemerocybe angulata]|uniref:G domain-containing protein n=1 Tax=Ephemerocybe angulata TaxID=980116 RepID=A0A8H5BV15_9AGAR|nr:hypothetical protein D9611_010506 [Tulosesus angulatus]